MLTYCLMPNHLHRVMAAVCEDGLKPALGEAHRRYSLRINQRHQWRGHRWQARFHAFPMDRPHLLATLRYVEQNPVAANLCQRAQHWPQRAQHWPQRAQHWPRSSAATHLGLREDPLVDLEPMRSVVGDWAAYLEQPGDEAIRARIARHSRAGRRFGDDGFVRTLEQRAGRTLRPGRPGRRKRTTKRRTSAESEPPRGGK